MFVPAFSMAGNGRTVFPRIRAVGPQNMFKTKAFAMVLAWRLLCN
jgi:hypothetical protein